MTRDQLEHALRAAQTIKKPPYNVPELERTLEKERANELAVGRSGPS